MTPSRFDEALERDLKDEATPADAQFLESDLHFWREKLAAALEDLEFAIGRRNAAALESTAAKHEWGSEKYRFIAKKNAILKRARFVRSLIHEQSQAPKTNPQESPSQMKQLLEEVQAIRKLFLLLLKRKK